MERSKLSLTAKARIATKFVFMRRVVAFFLLLAGAIQFMGCGAESPLFPRSAETAIHSSWTEACPGCPVSPTSDFSGDAGFDHEGHLFCASHCASCRLVEALEISPVGHAPSRTLIVGQLLRAFLTPQNSVFEPPRA